MKLVSSKKDESRIAIRVIFFTWEKMDFVRKKVEEHNLHLVCMRWGGRRWPSVHVKGNKEDIQNFFEDLKEKFFLSPYYLNNNC